MVVKTYQQLKYSSVLEHFLIEHYIPYSLEHALLFIKTKDYKYFKYVWTKQSYLLKKHKEELAIVKVKA